MKDIILIGGGGHCRSVIDVIELGNEFRIIEIIDKEENIGKDVLGYPIIAPDNELPDLHRTVANAFVTIGHIASNDARKRLFLTIKKLGFNIPIIISPLAYVSKYASIGEGTIVMHQALINTNARVGRNCIINTKALIEHDAIIEDNCHVSTAAVVNGGVCVKEDTFFGSNATSKQSAVISGFIKAGSVVK